MSKYLKFKDISQYEFSKSTGLANGYLNSGDNITSANLDIITNIYCDLNLIWLVKGTGPMILPEKIKLGACHLGEADSSHSISNENGNSSCPLDYTNEESGNIPKEELIKINKMFRQIIHSKDEVILAKNNHIATLEELMNEKENSLKTKDQVIALLQQNSPGKSKVH